MTKLHESFLVAIEAELKRLLPQGPFLETESMNKAIQYAVLSGGKRARPVITLLTSQLLRRKYSEFLPAACAVEFIHASSLIIDDLPSMDNASMRRGKATVHLVFGEDIALLSAIALLNAAYGIFSSAPRLVSEAAACIGVCGMIGGQAIDLCRSNSLSISEQNRYLKTSSLMRLTFTAGALSCGAHQNDVIALARAGEFVGDAYQVYDDYLDGDSNGTGKASIEDGSTLHLNYASGYEVDTSKRIAILIDAARNSLLERFESVDTIEQIMDFSTFLFRCEHAARQLANRVSGDTRQRAQ
jgi:geranylgeranyl diphosphate synthase, type II